MDQQKIGHFIASLRRQKGLTQEALGEKIGVTNKTISRWETGKGYPDITLIEPIAAALNVSVMELGGLDSIMSLVAHSITLITHSLKFVHSNS